MFTLAEQRISVADFSCGSDHMVVLTTSSEVYSWGSNLAGQLGRELPESPTVIIGKKSSRGGALVRCPPRRLEDCTYDSLPRPVPSLQQYPVGRVLSVSCGRDFTLVACDRCTLPRPKDVQNAVDLPPFVTYQPLVHAMVKVRDDVSGVKQEEEESQEQGGQIVVEKDRA